MAQIHISTAGAKAGPTAAARRYGDSNSGSDDEAPAAAPTAVPAMPAPAPAAAGEPELENLRTRRLKKGLALSPKVVSASQPMRNSFSFSGVTALVDRLTESGRMEGEVAIPLGALEEVRPLGEGSQGAVSLMVHRESGEFVAVKRIRLDLTESDEAHKKRTELFTEIKTYVQSSCASIVRSFGAYCDDGIISIVLEYMDCGSLKGLLARVGSMPEGALAAVVAQVLTGLRYLHEVRRLVHRDLKPENILLSSDGFAKIADFGVSKELENTLANCDSFIGTVTYMSPERLDTMRAVSGYGFAADIWSLGMVVAECAMGQYPYPPTVTSQFLAHMEAVCEADAPLDAWLPAAAHSEALRDFVRQCLPRQADKRPSASALLSHPFVADAAERFDLATWLRDTVVFTG
eukprot:c12760_g1_i1.p1 GENE.c12760_g1_i1~~c12760_g1_i1.p1  ORF type:complete len:405 (-),score=77.63 c12760_g1_i1:1207-2421(-)